MTRTVFMLEHHDGLGPGHTPDPLLHDGKHIGTYTTEDRAMQALRRVADQPGFRDWPDGFRLRTIEVDRDFWREGFIQGPGGADIALARDEAPVMGSDAGLEASYGDGSRDLAEEERQLLAFSPAERAGWLWDLWHFKISERSDATYEDMGMKLVGLYATEAGAKHAIERLRGKPGFRDWPGGFRLYGGPPDVDHWLEGYAPYDDPD